MLGAVDLGIADHGQRAGHEQAALSNEHVQKLAASLGLSTDDAVKILSQHLPAAVDQASPNGTLQS
jgi:uncharacterized protein YidB (DUF937 family)